MWLVNLNQLIIYFTYVYIPLVCKAYCFALKPVRNKKLTLWREVHSGFSEMFLATPVFSATLALHHLFHYFGWVGLFWHLAFLLGVQKDTSSLSIRKRNISFKIAVRFTCLCIMPVSLGKPSIYNACAPLKDSMKCDLLLTSMHGLFCVTYFSSHPVTIWHTAPLERF